MGLLGEEKNVFWRLKRVDSSTEDKGKSRRQLQERGSGWKKGGGWCGEKKANCSRPGIFEPFAAQLKGLQGPII